VRRDLIGLRSTKSCFGSGGEKRCLTGSTKLPIFKSEASCWRILDADAIKPWRYESWIFSRDPQFADKAGRVLDLYVGFWEGKPLGRRDYIISSDEKTSIQARIRQSLPACERHRAFHSLESVPRVGIVSREAISKLNWNGRPRLRHLQHIETIGGRETCETKIGGRSAQRSIPWQSVRPV
jgi:hypothetical protein